MNANMKPIDAIRREMNHRGYDVGLDINRRDICDLLGVSRKTSYKRLCGILEVEYNSNCHGQFRESNRKYIIDIENPLDYIEFESFNTLCDELLMVHGSNSSFLMNYIYNQYVVYYNDRKYIISETPQIELSPNYRSPYMMTTIQQKLKCRGYDITRKTNRKDVCSMLGLSSDSTKKEICEKLDIPYVKTRERVEYRWKKIQLTNIYDPSHTIEYISMKAASRELKIHNYQLNFYINNPNLTVEYEGCVFNVSFTE